MADMSLRHHALPLLLPALLLLASCGPKVGAESEETAAAPAFQGFHALAVKTLEGQDADLAAYQGKVTLVVNVASKCGYTPQYEGLEALWRKYKDRGLFVVGFPSNEFGGQEPGTPEEIRQFCTENYDVTFPLMAKIKTQPGEDQSPVYTFLGEKAGKFPRWNFGKYLVGKDGTQVEFFDTKVPPDDPALVAAIEKALAE